MALSNCPRWSCTPQKFLTRWLSLLSLDLLLSAHQGVWVTVDVSWRAAEVSAGHTSACKMRCDPSWEVICFACQVTLACSETLVCQCCQATAPASNGTKLQICPSLLYRAELVETCPPFTFFTPIKAVTILQYITGRQLKTSVIHLTFNKQAQFRKKAAHQRYFSNFKKTQLRFCSELKRISRTAHKM